MDLQVKKTKKGLLKIAWPFKILIVVLLIGIGWFAYTKFFKATSTQPEYQTSTVQKGTLVSTVTAAGQVSTANNTPVVTQVTGVITRLYVNNGDTIQAGAPIATVNLDRSSNQKYIQQQASYQSAQNSLVSAKTQQYSLKSSMVTAEQNFIKQALNKNMSTNNPVYIELNNTKKAAEKQYENQSNVIAQVEMSLTSATLSLQQFSPTIYAPISGIITGLSLQEGSVIPAQAVSTSTTTTSQNIASITTSNYPIITINLTEIDVPKIKIGNKATVTFDAFPDKTFTGKVFSINTTGSVSSGVTTYPTTINLDLANSSIYANMSVSANIIIDSKDNVLYVPTAAVQNQNGQSTVRVLKNGQVQNVDVVIGISSDTDIEIASGLNEGDEVVTSVITQTTATSGVSSPFGIRTGGIGGGRNIGR